MKHNINPALEGLMVAIDFVHYDTENLRKHSEENIKAIEVSYESHGQQKPIVVSTTGKVLAGNGQLQAAHNLGWSHIAVITFSGDKDSAFAIADNRTAELASWDEENLLSVLDSMDFEELTLTGFSQDDVLKLLPKEPKPQTTAKHSSARTHKIVFTDAEWAQWVQARIDAEIEPETDHASAVLIMSASAVLDAREGIV